MAQYPTAKTDFIFPESGQLEYETAIFLKWIAGAIRQERARFGITQAQLAKTLCIPRCRLSHLENGSVDFRISTLLRIATVLGGELAYWVPTREDLRRAARYYGGWAVERRGLGVLSD